MGNKSNLKVSIGVTGDAHASFSRTDLSALFACFLMNRLQRTHSCCFLVAHCAAKNWVHLLQLLAFSFSINTSDSIHFLMLDFLRHNILHLLLLKRFRNRIRCERSLYKSFPLYIT